MRSIILTFLCALIISFSINAQVIKESTDKLIPKAYLKIDGSVHWFMEPVDEINNLNTPATNVCGAVPGITVMTDKKGSGTIGFRVNQEGTFVDSVYFSIPGLPGICGISDMEFHGSYIDAIDQQTGTADINLMCASGFYPGFSLQIDFKAKTVTLTVHKNSDCDACSAVQLSFATTDAKTINVETPDKFYLNQNYPNPFNPNTIIRYSIPQAGFITLKIYDILGNEIATLVNEDKPTGNYEVEFSGSNLPSGLYFYSINSGNFNQVKKMVLLK